MKTTSTAGLEVLLGIPPFYLFLKGEAQSALGRISLVLGRRVTFGSGIRSRKTEHLLAPVTDIVGGQVGIDILVPRINFLKRFEVIVPTRDQWSEENLVDEGR